MILSANVLTLLCRQYSHEIANSLFYTSLQSWADMRGLDGTAGFFGRQADDEHRHADMVLAYIHARNEQLANMPPVAPMAAGDDFMSQFDTAREIESRTTAAISAIHAQALAESDMMTCAWLAQPGGLILEQLEEENTIQSIIDRINARRGNVPLDPADVSQAEMPGEVIHDIDCWLKGLA